MNNRPLVSAGGTGSGRMRWRRRAAAGVLLLATCASIAVPAIVLRADFRQSILLLMPGFVATFGWALLVEAAVVKDSTVLRDSEIMNVSTWLGSSTVDLAGLRSIRCRKLQTKMGPVVYFSVADGSGVSYVFDGRRDRDFVVERIRQVCSSGRAEGAVYISERALSEAGISEYPKSLAIFYGSLYVASVIGIFIATIAASVFLA